MHHAGQFVWAPRGRACANELGQAIPAVLLLSEVRGSLQMQSFAKRLVPRAGRPALPAFTQFCPACVPGLDSLVLTPTLKQSLGSYPIIQTRTRRGFSVCKSRETKRPAAMQEVAGHCRLRESKTAAAGKLGLRRCQCPISSWTIGSVPLGVRQTTGCGVFVV